MAGRRAPPADRFAMTRETEARAVLSCATLKISQRAWMEKAALAQLDRDWHQLKVESYEAKKLEARARRMPEPLPQDFGLPHSFR
jgi:hypothetical protein